MSSLQEFRRALLPRERTGPFVLGLLGGVALSVAFTLGLLAARPTSRPDIVRNDTPVVPAAVRMQEANDRTAAASAAPVPEPSTTVASTDESARATPRVPEAPADDARPKAEPPTTEATVEARSPAAGGRAAVIGFDVPAEERAGAVAVTAVASEPRRPVTEPFSLGELNRPNSPCYVLPRDPWFALERLKVDEPTAQPQVCAVDRSLNTALTWAKSPKEAGEQAKRDHKLVFLIHVSGNFENPGFT
jgi:hypothetical protein